MYSQNHFSSNILFSCANVSISKLTRYKPFVVRPKVVSLVGETNISVIIIIIIINYGSARKGVAHNNL